MGYVWDMYGICMEYPPCIYEVSPEYVRSIVEVSPKHLPITFPKAPLFLPASCQFGCIKYVWGNSSAWLFLKTKVPWVDGSEGLVTTDDPCKKNRELIIDKIRINGLTCR